MLNGYDYYTGIVFRGYLSTIGEAVLKGGRYDNLVGEFGRQCNAVGFGVNVDSAAKHMIICGNSKKAETSQVLVFGKAGHEVDAMRYVLDLQNKGIRAENSLFDSREESEEYAKKHGIKELAVIGDDVSVIPLSE